MLPSACHCKIHLHVRDLFAILMMHIRGPFQLRSSQSSFREFRALLGTGVKILLPIIAQQKKKNLT